MPAPRCCSQVLHTETAHTLHSLPTPPSKPHAGERLGGGRGLARGDGLGHGGGGGGGVGARSLGGSLGRGLQREGEGEGGDGWLTMARISLLFLPNSLSSPIPKSFI